MWYSSEKPLNSIPHQRPSLNHSLLCTFEALGPCVHLTSGLKERGRPKATPARRTIAPNTIGICVQSLCLWVTPAITYCVHLISISRRARESRSWTTGTPSLAIFVDNCQPTTILADIRYYLTRNDSGLHLLTLKCSSCLTDGMVAVTRTAWAEPGAGPTNLLHWSTRPNRGSTSWHEKRPSTTVITIA